MSRAQGQLPSHCTAKERTLGKWEWERKIERRCGERRSQKKEEQIYNTRHMFKFAALLLWSHDNPSPSLSPTAVRGKVHLINKARESSRRAAQRLWNLTRLSINEQMELENGDTNKKSAGVFLCRAKNKITSTVMEKE